jgi:hypothetical protein
LSQGQREPLIPGPRARALAEARKRPRKPEEGRPSKKEVSENPGLILEPAKHFALMFGISPDYAYMARAVRACSGDAGRSDHPPAGGCSMTIFLTLLTFTGGTLFGAVGWRVSWPLAAPTRE